MTAPFFSVIIPVYNRAGRVGPTFQSLIDQTFTDWEALIVDDGSADGEELRSAVEALDDPRFTYIRRENGGGCAARNTGIDAARGRFIAFLDSDDLYLPERLSRAADKLRHVGDEDTVVFSQYYGDRGVGRRWVRPRRGPRPGERIDEYLMCDLGKIQTSTIAMSASLARRVRFGERLPSSQDTDFAVRCASAGAKFIYIPEPLTIYQDAHDESRVSRQKSVEPLAQWIDGMRGVHISDRAYWGYRGWHCARIASYKNRRAGLGFYLPSAVRGVYPPKHAARIAGQVLIPQKTYQRIIDFVVRNFGK